MRIAVIVLTALTAAGAQTEPEEKKPIEPLSKATPEDLAKGKRLFAGHCAPCHGPDGNGGHAANLAQPKLARAPDDDSLFRVIKSGIEGTEMPAAWQMIDREIWLTAAWVKKLGQLPAEKIPGDAARGKTLYATKGNCQSCHTIRGVGGKFGPELSEIGLKRNAAYLKRSLLEPEAEVPDGFRYLKVVTRDGKSYVGVRLNEDTFSLLMMDASERVRAFWKHELKQIEGMKNPSPMPSYRGVLTAEEVDDIVAYLVSLRGGQ